MIVCIVILSYFFRTFNLNWDAGIHLHPDERMLIMVAERIQFFSQLNPDFFNYGTLPIYILRGITTFLAKFPFTEVASTYDGMLIPGRYLSAFFDTLTILFIAKIAELLFRSNKTALFAALVYGLMFFPIQNSHFFIVDTFLTSFVTLTLLLLITFIRKPSALFSILLAASTAAALTSKITAVIFLPIIGLGMFVGLCTTRPTTLRLSILTVTKQAVRLLGFFLLFSLSLLLFAFFFMPYAFLDHGQFLKEVVSQIRMNNDAFVFPYTRQYVNTTPYWYYFKQIALWGAGPIATTLGLVGLVLVTKKMVGSIRDFGSVNFTKPYHIIRKLGQLKPYLPHIIVALWYLVYILIIGKSAVKFMRYMLPVYPALALVAGRALDWIWNMKPTRSVPGVKLRLGKLTVLILLVSLTIWTWMFTGVYRTDHSRVTASIWIYEHIPQGNRLAVEHWDDHLPLPLDAKVKSKSQSVVGDTAVYHYQELPLFEPDTPQKWQQINTILKDSDYIIIASNRLYTPLARLTDCSKLPVLYCYRETASYYHELFAGMRGFHQVAEFTSYPSLDFGVWKLTIPDDSADESFTVYDHPKVIIFQKDSFFAQ